MENEHQGEWMDQAPAPEWEPWLMPQERGESCLRLILRWLLTRLPR